MTFHNNTIKASKYSAIVLSGSMRSRRASNAPPPKGLRFLKSRCHSNKPEISGHLIGGSFGRFQGDVTGETFGYNNIDIALADIITFDKAHIFLGGFSSRSGRRILYLFVP